MTTPKSALDTEADQLRAMIAKQPLQVGGLNDNSQKKLTLHLWDALGGLNRTTTKLNKILIWLTGALVVIAIAQVWIAWVAIHGRH